MTEDSESDYSDDDDDDDDDSEDAADWDELDRRAAEEDRRKDMEGYVDMRQFLFIYLFI